MTGGGNPLSKAIVFIGFMGAGKTTALAAARRGRLETTEVDDLMAGEIGMPIAAAFERFGEEASASARPKLVGGLLERARGRAIALAAGSVLSPRIREALGTPHRRLAAGRPGRGLEPHCRLGAAAGDQRPGRRGLLATRLPALTKSSPTPSSRRATAASCPRPAGDPGARRAAA